MQTNAFKKRRGGAEQLTYQTFLLTHLATIPINAVMEEHVEEATGQVLVSTSKTSRKKRKWETIKDQGPPLLEVEEDQPPEKKVYLLI